MATKKKPAAGKTKKAKQKKAPASAAPSASLPFDIDPDAIEASLERLRENVVPWARKGRYTKVRFKFRGKQLLPDIPLAAVVAAEGLTFYWTGILRALIFNVVGRNVIDVELVNDAEGRIALGKEKLLVGELDEALALFLEAREMDARSATVQLNCGIAFKLKGQKDDARTALELARKLGAEGPVAQEAERLLQSLR